MCLSGSWVLYYMLVIAKKKCLFCNEFQGDRKQAEALVGAANISQKVCAALPLNY